VSNSVTVEGVVTDKKSRKPIKGAVILILQPGVSAEDWVEDDQPDEDVYTAGKTDSKGKFTLEHPLERETVYSIIVVAKSYKPLANDSFEIAADEADPVQLTIKLTK
jgi:serine protease Do